MINEPNKVCNRLMMYNWQLRGWPNFTYDVAEVQPLILAFAQETGEVNGLVQGLPDTLKQETLLQFMLSEAVKTSEIEGEHLSREDSSVLNNFFCMKKSASALFLRRFPLNLPDVSCF